MGKHLALLAVTAVIGLAQAQSVIPNPTDSATAQANALLKKMTAAEKVGQLTQLFLFPQPVDLPGVPHDAVSYEDHVRRGEVGSFLFVTDPARINQLQKIAVTETRLKIPIPFGFDVIHGFDTEFPAPIGMAVSWDPALAEQAKAAAAEEATHAGVRWSFAPMVDIARDPRWGRISEGAGEDPYLGAAMARAQVYGFQGRPNQNQASTPDFVWAWMHLKSGSIWPCVVLHAAHNTFIQSFFDPLTVHNKRTNYVANEFGAGLFVHSILIAISFWRRRAEVELPRSAELA